MQVPAGLHKAAKQTGISESTAQLVALCASQITAAACASTCILRELENLGGSATRINTLAARRDVPYFTDAERAALELTEAATRIADRPDPVSDSVRVEAARNGLHNGRGRPSDP